MSTKEEIVELIAAKGEVIRSMKSAGASKGDLQPEIDALLQLKVT
jgi:hypothetical protein